MQSILQWWCKKRKIRLTMGLMYMAIYNGFSRVAMVLCSYLVSSREKVVANMVLSLHQVG